jgi:hypothetical protein
MTCSTDLDVATPEEVSAVLRAVAEKYRESQGELQSTWQDQQAGRVWAKLAAILERAADQADKAVARYV